MKKINLVAKNSNLIIIDSIRIINLFNINMLVGLVIAQFVKNKYVILMAVLIFATLITYLSQIMFIKHYKQDVPLFKSKISIILSISINIFVLSYFLIIGEYIMAIIMVLFMVIYSFILKLIKVTKMKKGTILKWGLH
jgi:hypothetical protein